MTELRGFHTICFVCGYDYSDERHREGCVNSIENHPEYDN